MSKLDEIEVRMNNTWIVYGQDSVGGPTSHHDYAQCNVDVSLLTCAVRQLGAERAVYQELFEAVDDDYKSLIETHPEIYAAYDNVSATAEPDADVLELIAPNE